MQKNEHFSHILTLLYTWQQQLHELWPVFWSLSHCLPRLWTLWLCIFLHQFSRVEDMMKLKVEDFDDGEHNTNSPTVETPY